MPQPDRKPRSPVAPETFERIIVQLELDVGPPEGYVLTLSCAHEVWTPCWPTGGRAYCAGCVNDALAAERKHAAPDR